MADVMHENPVTLGMGTAIRERLGLLSPEELAAMLDVGADTLREWRRLRQGPDFVKAGKGVLYRQGDVLSWMERNIVLAVQK